MHTIYKQFNRYKRNAQRILNHRIYARSWKPFYIKTAGQFKKKNKIYIYTYNINNNNKIRLPAVG